VRVERSLKGDFFQVRRKHPDHEEEVGVRGFGRDEELGRERTGDLGRFVERLREECDSVAEAAVRHAAVAGRRLGHEAQVGRVQVELGPARAGQRPLTLVALGEPLAGMAHLENDLRLVPPSGILALQEVAEKYAKMTGYRPAAGGR
jgi:hypothetical protein